MAEEKVCLNEEVVEETTTEETVVEETKTEETKRTIPVLLSPLVKNTIPNTIQIKAAILDHTKE